MSLAYPGMTTYLCIVVGRDAFLEALGNPSLHVHILEKASTTMEKALRIVLKLEDLDKSKEAEAKAMGGPQDKVVEEPRKKKDRYANVAAKSLSTPTVECNPFGTSSTLAQV